MRPSSSALLMFSLALAACSSGSGSDFELPRPTTIEVGSDAFLGAFTCQTSGLGMYVVTLRDTREDEVDDAGVPVAPRLFSSPPTRCGRTVVFGDPRDIGGAAGVGIRPGRSYDIEIDGYGSDDLKASEPGSRALVIPPAPPDAEPTPVEPAWKTSCPPLRAEFRQTRRPSGCTPLPFTAALGAIEVRIDAALGTLVCGPNAGQIKNFSVRRDGEEVGTASCDAAFVLADVEDGAVVSFEVFAFESGAAEPSFGTLCVARGVANSTVTALCEPLSASGAIGVELADVAAATGAACDPSLRALHLAPILPIADIPALSFRVSQCSGTATIPDLPPGSYFFTARAEPAGAQTATCSAEVEPGLVTELVCEADAP